MLKYETPYRDNPQLMRIYSTTGCYIIQKDTNTIFRETSIVDFVKTKHYYEELVTVDKLNYLEEEHNKLIESDSGEDLFEPIPEELYDEEQEG